MLRWVKARCARGLGVHARAAAAAGRGSDAAARGPGERAAARRARAASALPRRSGRRRWASPSGTSRLPSSTALVSVSGVALELLPIGIERGQRPPERFAAPRCSSGDRLEQPSVRQAAERLLGRARAQDLVVLLEQPRRGASRDLVTLGADRLDDRRSIVKSRRAARATARSMRTGSSRNRTSGSPIDRTMPARRSSRPPT